MGELTALYNPFENVNLDDVPSKSELESIWMYMNFQLNFKPLLKLQDPIKLEIQTKYLQYITELVAPDDPRSLAEGIRTVLDDQALAARLAGAGAWA